MTMKAQGNCDDFVYCSFCFVGFLCCFCYCCWFWFFWFFFFFFACNLQVSVRDMTRSSHS